MIINGLRYLLYQENHSTQLLPLSLHLLVLVFRSSAAHKSILTNIPSITLFTLIILILLNPSKTSHSSTNPDKNFLPLCYLKYQLQA